jgi:hypothetical protein
VVSLALCGEHHSGGHQIIRAHVGLTVISIGIAGITTVGGTIIELTVRWVVTCHGNVAYSILVPHPG